MLQARLCRPGEGLRVNQFRLGFFTEIYRPAVNGVVASVETLAEGLRARGHQVYCFAPSMPGGSRSAGDVFRLPSLPLPHASPSRLTSGAFPSFTFTRSS